MRKHTFMSENQHGQYTPDEIRKTVQTVFENRNHVPDVLALNRVGIPDIGFDINKWDGRSFIITQDEGFALQACALGAIPAPSPDNGGFLVLRESVWNLLPFVVAERLGTPTQNIKYDSFVLSEPVSYPYEVSNTGIVILCDMTKDDRFDIKRSHDAATNKTLVFKGTPDIDIQRAMLSRIACHDASLFYSRDFFIGDKYKRNVKGHRQAKALMESLTMGHPHAPKFPGYDEEELPRWKRKAVESVEVDSCVYDGALKEDITAYRFYADLATLWERVMDLPDTPKLCAQMYWSNLGDERLVKRTMSALGRAIEIESYVDALCRGVPLDDIFA